MLQATVLLARRRSDQTRMHGVDFVLTIITHPKQCQDNNNSALYLSIITYAWVTRNLEIYD